MFQRVVACAVLVFAFVLVCQAQDQATASAMCNFEDGQQMTVRYDATSASRKPQNGRIWSPGKAPMFLFTSAPLKVGNSAIPVGAYSMYLIPGKDQWTLVVNKNVSEKGEYNQQQDVLRAPMGIGTLSEATKTPNVAFGRMAPKQCNMRVYYEKVGAFVEFDEQ